MKNSNYKVKKVFNNNVVLVQAKDEEKILVKKAIGFGKKTGDIIPHDVEVEKIFVMSSENTNKFNKLLNNIDEDIIGICEEIISMISNELGETLNEKIHISLIDHIAFTLKRLRASDEIINPFIVETEILYKKEFDIAMKAVQVLEKRTGIEIPYGEIGFITLHIHSARNQGSLSNTVKYTFLCNSIIEYIEDSLDIYVDRQSLNYSRFITHIRFAIERILKNNPVKNELLKIIRNNYKESYKLAQNIATMIENQLNLSVPVDEIGFITIHIETLKNSNNN